MKEYSVLMSLYIKENPQYFIESVESMLKQSVPPDEIVIVKDGPITVELENVIDEYVSKYNDIFNIVDGKVNVGLGLALNLGLLHCRNDLVARMDTDDISKPNRCEKQLAMFDSQPKLVIVGAYVDEFVASPKEIVSTRRVPSEYKKIYEFAKRRSAFNHPSVMFRKSAVLAEGGYSDLRRNQDVDLFGRMLYHGYLAANIPESLLFFRANNDLSMRRKSWENTKSYIDTIKKFWRIGYSSFGDYTVVAIAQAGMFICPIKLQNWIYKNLLRK